MTGKYRLIPAHAGKTACEPGAPLLHEAHPRSRGENLRAAWRSSAVSGSSPLTRGKHSEALHGLAQARLIPAHAGKTQDENIVNLSKAAHPRSRGENRRPRRGSLGRGGSSPLTRGKPLSRRSPAPTCRLIPAHAGKTYRFDPSAFLRPAHPRSRGENKPIDIDFNTPSGSSPLTRGKLLPRGQRARFNRLIPAHAGKT